MTQTITNNKLILRVTIKILTTFGFLWVGYIFTAGFFDSDESSHKTQHIFDLSDLKDNQSAYYKVNNRELLVIKHNNKFSAFWAQDPIYGCRLVFINTKIKPVCIDIEYNLKGFSKNKQQQLLAPQYNISSPKTLTVN